jgi:hypothetical protein
MENIEDRLRKASMAGSIHELQDDSAGTGLMSEPPIFEDLKSEHPGQGVGEEEEEEEEAFEDAHDEFIESQPEVSPTKSKLDQVYC